MKRFRFRLEAVLKYKHHLEHKAGQEVAAARQEISACTERIAAWQQERDTSVAQVDAAVLQGISARDFKQHQAFLDAMADTIAREESRKAVLEQELVQKQEGLQQRILERKTLERLREKQTRDHYREMQKNEQKELDEITSLKTAREILNAAI